MRGICFIYGLRAKDATRYFYVGSTKHSVSHRWGKHQEQLVKNRNLHFVRTVQSIGVANVVVDILEEVSADLRFEREAFWIQTLPSLTNIVKNPARLRLSSNPKTRADVEAVVDRLRLLPGRLAAIAVEYGEAVVATLRVLEMEMDRRGQAAVQR